MPQEFNLQEALKHAIQTEKDVMDFYLKAAAAVTDVKAKKVFQTLATEEKEHAFNFFPRYTGGELGTFEEFISAPARKGSVMLADLEKSIGANTHEREAMVIALREEKDLASNLNKTAEKIIDPVVRQVFEKMAKETDNHYQIIEAEYAHMMGMVHDTDIDTYVRE